jgi:DNA-directed RNA polymerase subunit L
LNLIVNTVADNAISVQIEKEDYSIADILHRELLNVKHVKFAGVPPPHPLIKTLSVQIHTDGSKPTKALLDAIEISQAHVSELLAAAKQVFPMTGSKGKPSVENSEPKTAPAQST